MTVNQLLIRFNGLVFLPCLHWFLFGGKSTADFKMLFMAINETAARFILSELAQGINLDQTLTIGRQSLMVSPKDLYRLGKSYCVQEKFAGLKEFEGQIVNDPYYAEPWLKALGAKQALSLDCSDYEGADWIHDLNDPVPEKWRSSQTFILDCGSLEHVFNTAQALKSYIEMLQVGGDLIIGTVANNFCGHGFYQFSPEFFYRALSAENGMEVQRLALVEDDVVWAGALGYKAPLFLNGPFYETRDPDQDQKRVELIHRRQVMIFVHARKTANSTAIFKNTPQQSDYQAVWKNSSQASETHDFQQQGWIKKWLESKLSPAAFLHLRLSIVPRILRWLKPFPFFRRNREYTFRNREIYQIRKSDCKDRR